MKDEQRNESGSAWVGFHSSCEAEGKRSFFIHFSESTKPLTNQRCIKITTKAGGIMASGVDPTGNGGALPGYGDEKAKIFIALLGKRMSVQPADWQTAAGVFGDDVPRSVADSDGPESLGKVREWKKAQKAAKKDKQGRAATG